jgi:hypothetical protein
MACEEEIFSYGKIGKTRKELYEEALSAFVM